MAATEYDDLMKPADDAPSDAGEMAGFRHPGFTWLDESACSDIPLSEYFAKAGHVLSDRARKACMECPVWRECIIFSYLGNPDGKVVIGGYFAALSPGQRKRMNLTEALEAAEQMRAEYTVRTRVAG